VLRQQEQESGFRESPRVGQRFFREGRAGAWGEVLSERDARRVVDDHHDVMQRLGYLETA
jgi:hypothetical protein